MGQTEATVLGSLKRSIRSAVAAGRIDRDAQAALIAVALKVAAVMDDPDWPIVCKGSDGKGRLDNVSPSVLLKYCEALGIVPDIAPAEKKRVKSELSLLRSGVKAVGRPARCS